MLKRLFKSSPKTPPSSASPETSFEVEESSEAAADQAGIGIVFQIAPDGGFYIKSMELGGSADECGLLEEGDCLISVNSRKAFGVPPDVVTRLIIGPVGTPISVKFRRNVVLDNGTCEFQYFSPVLTRGKTAELPKPAGVGIIFRVGSDKGMYVKSLAADGPAAQSKQVMVDDCLVSVDGKEVYGKPVTDVTPLLTGAFGSQVELGLRAPGEKRARSVRLTRGKKATFLDERTKRRRKQERCISIMVPDDAEPLDFLEATDDKGQVLRIQVPLGAVPGTLLRVPIPIDTSRASSDEKLLDSMLDELQAVKGDQDVFMWKGRLLRRPKKNADGSITIIEDETGEAIWHGFYGKQHEDQTADPAEEAREKLTAEKRKVAGKLEAEKQKERKRKEEEEAKMIERRKAEEEARINAQRRAEEARAVERKQKEEEEAKKQAEQLQVSLRPAPSEAAKPLEVESPLSSLLNLIVPAKEPASAMDDSRAMVPVAPARAAPVLPSTPQELAMVPHSIPDLQVKHALLSLPQPPHLPSPPDLPILLPSPLPPRPSLMLIKQVSSYPASSPPPAFAEASGSSLARVDSSRLTALQSGVAPGMQVLSSARVVSDMANRVAKNLVTV